MHSALIQLAHRQVIDATAVTSFEKNVFNASYNEFLLKCQAYNMEGKFTSFSEMVSNNGKANSLHYKLSFPALPYIESLDKKIPLLTDNAGKNILFDDWEFRLIESDIKNKALHKLAVNYYTGTVTVLETLGEYMLLAMGDMSESLDNIADTFVLKMQDGLSITRFRQLPVSANI